MREVSAVPAYLSEGAVGCLSMELLQTLVPWSQIFHFTWEEVHMQGLASHRGKDSCASKSAGIQNSQRKDKMGHLSRCRVSNSAFSTYGS